MIKWDLSLRHKDGLTYKSINMVQHINRVRDKIHIISVNVDKIFDKIQYPSVIKMFNKVVIEEHIST